jgi:beta-glucanase (GH16 family)
MRAFANVGLALAAVILSACAAFPAQAPSATLIPVPEGYRLVWHDEFDRPAIDRSNWNFNEGAGGWGNGEAQFYTARPDNARVENGLLIIEARQEKYEGSYYTSARLKTQGLQEFQYGRIEARLKVPSGVGFWPAFWMLGSSFDGANWPDCGEIDIMEYVGREPDLVIGTAHGPGYSGALGISEWNRREENIADDFHTFAIDWTPGASTGIMTVPNTTRSAAQTSATGAGCLTSRFSSSSTWPSAELSEA